METIITSKTNAQLKDLASLIKYKKMRDKTGLFVLEGAKLIEDALSAGVTITKVFYTSASAQKYPIVSKASSNIRNTFNITQELADWVADTKSSQGIFAVCKIPERSLNISLEKNCNYIVFDNIQDPGNLGSMVRTALGFGVDGAFFTGECAEIYSPKVLRGSMGAVLKLKTQYVDNIEELLSSFETTGIKSYAMALAEDAVPINNVDFWGGSAVILGNEGAGLSKEVIEKSYKSVIIPMNSGAQSLNVSAAATIAMWEMVKNKL